MNEDLEKGLLKAGMQVGTPIESSLCGDCGLCIDFCPSKAIIGNNWSRNNPFIELLRLNNCSSHKKSSKAVNGKPNCGLCINICPYGRGKIQTL